MASWAEFSEECPDLAGAGARLFRQHGVALLSTLGADGSPRIAPVCPVLAGRHLHVIVAERSPKSSQLRRDPRYALHAFLGPDDEEFQVRGVAELVASEAERAPVHEAATFSFDAGDPVFRLRVEHGLWCHWERVGRPDTKPVRRHWSARKDAPPTDRAAPVPTAKATAEGGITFGVHEPPAAEDVARLDAGLTQHAAPFVPSPGFVPIAVLARDASSRLCGGASGRINWSWLHVSLLWVAPELRGTGLGASLLRRIERAAHERGCEHAHLDTFSYQARAFYERAGYERFAVLDDYPPGHQRIFMRKRLRPE